MQSTGTQAASVFYWQARVSVIRWVAAVELRSSEGSLSTRVDLEPLSSPFLPGISTLPSACSSQFPWSNLDEI